MGESEGLFIGHRRLKSEWANWENSVEIDPLISMEKMTKGGKEKAFIRGAQFDLP